MMSLPFLALAAQAQDQNIDEIIVTEQLEETIPLDLSRYGNQVEVITAADIQAHGFDDVSQTLQMLVPGLHVAPKNGPFDYITASLQGSRRQDILWLVDGVRITNRLYNGTSPLDTIPSHMVERIEILKGGQGIFYGTQSVGGVINIVTKNVSGEASGEIGTGVHSNDGYNVNGFYRGGNDSHRFLVYASKDEADGYQPYRDEDIQPSSTDRARGYDVTSLGIKYAFIINDDASLSLQYQQTDADLDFARPHLNNNTVNAREESIFTAKYEQRLNNSVELFVKAYQHKWDTEYTLVFNELDAGGNLTGGVDVIYDHSYWGYEDYGFNAMTKMNFGGDFEYILGIDQQNFSGEDEVWRIADQEERVTAPFVQIRTTEKLFANTLFAFGVRNNRATNMEDSTVWNATGKHDFTGSLYLQANIGTSFRMPDAEALFLNEIYDTNDDGIPDGFFSVGNPNLEPEESENINVSLGGSFDWLAYEATYFTRDITNYIVSYIPVTIAGVDGESFANSDDEVNINGYELVFAADLSASLNGQLSFIKTKSRFNDSGSQLDGIPETEVKLILNYQQSGSPYGIGLAANFVGDINDRQERGNYTVADLSGFYYLGSNQQHQLVLRLENMFDEEYSTGVSVGTIDATGDDYFYDNLGMQRTVHLNYSYHF